MAIIIIIFSPFLFFYKSDYINERIITVTKFIANVSYCSTYTDIDHTICSCAAEPVLISRVSDYVTSCDVLPTVCVGSSPG